MNKEIKLFVFIINIILIALCVTSIFNLTIFFLGKDTYLHIDQITDIKQRNYNNIWYYNKTSIIHKKVYLSFMEQKQADNNNGYIKFKQYGTFITHRSTAIYSSIYLGFYSLIIIVYLYLKKHNIKLIKTKEVVSRKPKYERKEQLSLDI